MTPPAGNRIVEHSAVEQPKTLTVAKIIINLEKRSSVSNVAAILSQLAASPIITIILNCPL
jgi:hypothetical protein